MRERNKEGKAGRSAGIGLVSLGCPKNLVDLQVMCSELSLAGYETGVPPESADVIIVNTCAFIEDARQEAVSAIMDACRMKKAGRCRGVIVTGCLSQRYGAAVFKACPETDAVVGIDSLDRIVDTVAAVLDGKSGVNEVLPGAPKRLFHQKLPGFVLTGGPFAYLKIGEGCSHACSFCAIPGIRGKLRSVSPDDVEREARELVKYGFRELNIVAQDVSSYGDDLRDGTNLAALLRRLDGIDGDFRIRLLYAHPAKINDELLSVIAEGSRICKYIDVPVQHSHPDILRAMHRADTVKYIPEMADRIRAAIPGVTLRTTCLVGFPGETEKHFTHLMDYVRETKFDRMGVFVFSPEDGTPAYDMGEEPDDVVGEERRKKLMSVQSRISKRILESHVGSGVRVLLEECSEDSENGVVWVGRTDGQAPDDIDGVSYVMNVPDGAQPGDFVRAEVVGVHKSHDFVCRCP